MSGFENDQFDEFIESLTAFGSTTDPFANPNPVPQPTLTRRTTGSKRGRDSNGEWTCRVCTVVNPQAHICCGTCGGIPGRSVVCQCGYVNSDRTHCQSCQAPLPDVAIPTPEEIEIEEISSDDDDLADYRNRGVEGDEELAPNEAAAVNGELEGVDLSSFPVWNIPKSMEKYASLMEYQQQGISWMLSRETAGMGQPRTVMSRSNSGTITAAFAAASSSSSSLPAAAQTAEAQTLPSCATPRQLARDIQDSVSRINTIATQHLRQRVIAHEPNLEYSGGILGDYMGLGKTRTIIGLVEASRELYRAPNSPQGRAPTLQEASSQATLIIAPATIIKQWQHEIMSTVYPPPRILMFYGSSAGRKSTAFTIAENYDYVITSTGTLSIATGNDTEKLLQIHWRRVVIDEGHALRSAAGYSNYFQLKSTCRWIVTGTPIVNRCSDLQNYFNFFKDDILKNGAIWQSLLRIARPDVMKMIKQVLRVVMMRRSMTSTIRGRPIIVMPTKITETIYVPVDGREKDLHDLLLEEGRLRAKERGVNAAFSLALLLRCRQACLSSYSFRSAVAAKGDFEAELQRLISSSQHALEYQAQKLRKAIKTKSTSSNPDDQKWLAKLQANMTSMQLNTSFVESVLTMIKEMKVTEEECVICMDSVSEPSILPCGHIFCGACIKRCFQMALAEKRCPMCKNRCHTHSIMEIPQQFVSEEAANTVTAAMAERLKVDTNYKEQLQERLNARKKLLTTFHKITASTSIEQTSRSKAVIEYIKNKPKADEKVLVMTEFLSFIQVVADGLTKEKISFELLDSSVTIAKREKNIKAFNQIEGGPKVLLTTIKSCGVGINLIRGNHCILVGPHWSPAIEEQAVNRLHRIGQVRPVNIARFLSLGTVEEGIYNLCNTRRNTVQGMEDNEPAENDFISILGLSKK